MNSGLRRARSLLPHQIRPVDSVIPCHTDLYRCWCFSKQETTSAASLSAPAPAGFHRSPFDSVTLKYFPLEQITLRNPCRLLRALLHNLPATLSPAFTTEGSISGTGEKGHTKVDGLSSPGSGRLTIQYINSGQWCDRWGGVG